MKSRRTALLALAVAAMLHGAARDAPARAADAVIALRAEFGTTTGDAYPGLSRVLGTYDRERGLGALNRARFSDTRFDALLAQAQAQTDPAAREARLRQAARVAFVEDVAVVPLHFLNNVWATRRGLRYDARADESTLAMFLTPDPAR